jgi:hypothetical protein
MSIKLPILWLGITLGLSAASEIPILSDCEVGAEVRAKVAKDADVKVRSSVSSGTPCFAVMATVDGKPVQGYVTDASLDAVGVFEKERVESLRATLSAPPVITSPPPAAPPPPAATKPEVKPPEAAPVPEAPKPPQSTPR